MKLKRVVVSIIACVLTGIMLIGCERQSDKTEIFHESSEEVDVPSLYGKVVYVLGDSIPYLSGSWVDSLAEKTGAEKVINCSRAGATWAWRESYESYLTSELLTKEIVPIVSQDGKTASSEDNNEMENGNIPINNSNYTYINNEIAFMQRLIQEGYAEPDVIVISCGINDTGSYTEVYSDELFEKKFYTDRDSLDDSVKKTLGGGLRANLEALKDLYPNAIIIVSTPIQSAYAYLRPYIPNTCMWIEKMAAYYSIPVIDAYSESGILAEFEKGWENDSYTGEGTEGKYLFDGLHPNSDGYQLLSDYFSRQINKICRNSMEQ